MHRGDGALALFIVLDVACYSGYPFLSSGYFCVHEEASKSSIRLIGEVGCSNTRFVLVHASGSDQVHMASGRVGYSFHVRQNCSSVYRFLR